MATLALTVPTFNGTQISGAAASGGGDLMPNDGRTVLHVQNNGGSPINVTITPSGTAAGLSYQAIVQAVAAGTIKVFGPFPTQQFNNANGQVPITYSGVTSVLVTAVQVP